MAKANSIGFRILLILLSLGFLFSGGGKAFGLPEALAQNATLHLDEWFIRLIGLFELIGVAGLWVSRWRTSAAICLSVLMIGAIGCHLGAAQPQNVVPATVFFALLMVVLGVDPANRLVIVRRKDPALHEVA